jgi:diguanylate cyclase (GGDEF)-like protein
MILSDAESRDIEVLIDRMTNEIEEYDLSVANLETQIEKLLSLIDNFSDRNKEMMNFHYQEQMEDSGTDYILKNVEDAYYNDNETTYDGLIQEYVALRTECEQTRISREHDEYLLSVFSELMNNKRNGTRTTLEIQTALDRYADTLNEYYDILDVIGDELSNYLSADYLQMVSTISVDTAVNISLYTKLAVIMFVLVGCGGAVLLGRALDFVEYFLYNDKTVNISNRARCDLYINDMSKQLLHENYTCVFMTFDSLADLSQKYGRVVGDEVMRDFASIIKSFNKVYDFAGYNGSGEFVVFFTNCSSSKAEVITTTFGNQIAEYNRINQGHEIYYSIASKTSSDVGIYEIRALLRSARDEVIRQKTDKADKARKSKSRR